MVLPADVRSHGSSISFRSSSDRHAVPSAPQKSSLPKNEHIDTVVTKTNVEERLKFVDVDFIQEVEKFVEVPEVFYNDVVVEVNNECFRAMLLSMLTFPLQVSDLTVH